MSTFGRGIRYELKEAIVIGSVGVNTVLTVPGNSNYFIFINSIISIRDSNQFQIERYLGSGTGTRQYQPIELNLSATTTLVLGGSQYSDFCEYGNPVPYAEQQSSAPFELRYNARFLFPQDRLRYNSNVNGIAAIRYQEIYYSGQSSY